MKRSIHLQAPAKINLTLEVLARLPDGYHALDSWMHKVSLFDHIRLKIVDQPGILLSCSEPSLPVGEDNLIWRAADLFYNEIGVSPRLTIELQKNIPVAAGLGGGSSDCAATLKGLNVLHGRPLSQERLLALGKGLGADVPFFVHPAVSARAQGIGERLSALPPLRGCYVVLTNPGMAVSTKWVFENLAKKFTGTSQAAAWENSPNTANYALTTGGKKYILGRSLQGCIDVTPVNDLEEVTIAKYPEILVVKEFFLAHRSCGTLMSGSGSTVFGIFSDWEKASASVEAMKVHHPHWRSFITEPLDHEILPALE